MHHLLFLTPIPFTLQTTGGGTTGGSLLAEDYRGASRDLRAPCGTPRAELRPALKIASNDAPDPRPALKIASNDAPPRIVPRIVPGIVPNTMHVIKPFEGVPAAAPNNAAPDISASVLLSSVRCYT